MPFGRQSSLVVSGAGIQLTADGRPEWKPAGVTIDWTNTVAAVASNPFTIPGDLYAVPVGQKYLRYGQLLCKITTAPVITLTQTGTLTAGTFTLTLRRPDTQALVTTAAIAYNATAAAVLAAIQAVMGPNQVTSSGGGALPGTPVTVTFAINPGLPTANSAGLTGGTIVPSGPTGNTLANYGMYGPYDTAATDGRQTLTPGECGLLNETILQSGLVVGLPPGNVDHAGIIVGGYVYKDRLLATAGTHSLAAGPTYTELLAALPRLLYVEGT